MGFKTNSFILNSSDAIICIIYIMLIPVGFRILAQFLPNKNIVKNLDRNIIYPFFPVVIYISVLILSFASFLNFIEFNVETQTESIGSLASYGYLIFIFLFWVILVIITGLYWHELRCADKKEFANLAATNDRSTNSLKEKIFFDPYRKDHLMHYSYPVFFIARRV
jgi:uncharacterized membrane protein YbjE (DUF340 family)